MILPAVNPYKWTRQEYNEMEDNGMFHPGSRHELVNGDIIDVSPETSLHSSAVKIVNNIINPIIPDGCHIRIQKPLALGRNSEPEPDIAVVFGKPLDYNYRAPEGALLIIEISESFSILFDRKIKKKLYAGSDIPEYWIINLKILCLEVYRNPFKDSYTDMKVLHAMDTISPLCNPEAIISINNILI